MSAVAAGAPASTAPRLPPELQAEVDRYKSIQAGVHAFMCGDLAMCEFMVDCCRRFACKPWTHACLVVDRFTELNKLIGKQTQLGAQMNENVVVKEVTLCIQ